MLRITVCDDDTEFLKQAVNLIERWSEQSNIPSEIFQFDNGETEKAKEYIREILQSVDAKRRFLDREPFGRNYGVPFGRTIYLRITDKAAGRFSPCRFCI